jgi:autoinducer 2 (AI-2) kinase
VTALDVEDVVFTGGAAKGELWPRILADVLGVPVRVPLVKESTALGAAVCAGLGAGVYSSLGDAARLVRFERTFEPDPGASAAYEDLYEQWRDVYRRVLQISEDGVVRPLWRAAGT